MDVNEVRAAKGRVWVRVLVTIVVCLVIAGGAAGASWFIFSSEPTAQREGATRRTAALVETAVAERGTFRPRLEVLGRVEPARDVELASRVGGHVVAIERGFVPGGIVRAGDPLLRVDPVDYENVVATRESEVQEVEAELAIERGRQRVAEQEFELLGEEIDATDRGLVLREPQIASVRARLAAARAALRQAQLDLERATVRAPFDAQVLERAVNVGSQVAPGQMLGRLVGVEEYWIVASVPLRDVRWLRFAEGDETGAHVRVRHSSAWAPGQTREGELARLIGTVDQATRLARVLVTVTDPLARSLDGPPLILDTIVRVEIEGRALEDVVRIERRHLRQGDTVWVMEDGALSLRDAQVVFRDAEYAYLSGGVGAGEHVVTTSLATVTDGLPLRRVDADETSVREPAAQSPSSADTAASSDGASR